MKWQKPANYWFACSSPWETCKQSPINAEIKRRIFSLELKEKSSLKETFESLKLPKSPMGDLGGCINTYLQNSVQIQTQNSAFRLPDDK